METVEEGEVPQPSSSSSANAAAAGSDKGKAAGGTTLLSIKGSGVHARESLSPAPPAAAEKARDEEQVRRESEHNQERQEERKDTEPEKDKKPPRARVSVALNVTGAAAASAPPATSSAPISAPVAPLATAPARAATPTKHLLPDKPTKSLFQRAAADATATRRESPPTQPKAHRSHDQQRQQHHHKQYEEPRPTRKRSSSPASSSQQHAQQQQADLLPPSGPRGDQNKHRMQASFDSSSGGEGEPSAPLPLQDRIQRGSFGGGDGGNGHGSGYGDGYGDQQYSNGHRRRRSSATSSRGRTRDPSSAPQRTRDPSRSPMSRTPSPLPRKRSPTRSPSRPREPSRTQRPRTATPPPRAHGGDESYQSQSGSSRKNRRESDRDPLPPKDRDEWDEGTSSSSRRKSSGAHRDGGSGRDRDSRDGGSGRDRDSRDGDRRDRDRRSYRNDRDRKGDSYYRDTDDRDRDRDGDKGKEYRNRDQGYSSSKQQPYGSKSRSPSPRRGGDYDSRSGGGGGGGRGYGSSGYNDSRRADDRFAPTTGPASSSAKDYPRGPERRGGENDYDRRGGDGGLDYRGSGGGASRSTSGPHDDQDADWRQPPQQQDADWEADQAAQRRSANGLPTQPQAARQPNGLPTGPSAGVWGRENRGGGYSGRGGGPPRGGQRGGYNNAAQRWAPPQYPQHSQQYQQQQAPDYGPNGPHGWGPAPGSGPGGPPNGLPPPPPPGWGPNGLPFPPGYQHFPPPLQQLRGQLPSAPMGMALGAGPAPPPVPPPPPPPTSDAPPAPLQREAQPPAAAATEAATRPPQGLQPPMEDTIMADREPVKLSLTPVKRPRKDKESAAAEEQQPEKKKSKWARVGEDAEAALSGTPPGLGGAPKGGAAAPLHPSIRETKTPMNGRSRAPTRSPEPQAVPKQPRVPSGPKPNRLPIQDQFIVNTTSVHQANFSDLERDNREKEQRDAQDQHCQALMSTCCSDIGRYNMKEKLGEGTFGTVWKATRKPPQNPAEEEEEKRPLIRVKTGDVVALKQIILHNENDGLPITSLREIKLLLQLSHPNVVPVVDMAIQQANRQSLTGATTFMVFPYMDHDLAGLLESKALQIPEADLKQWTMQLLEGTAYLHKNNILHRDMKAANLLLNNDGRLMIADFGLARPLETQQRAYTETVVTRWYRPPELLLGERSYGFAVDIWGVGCVVAEMWRRSPILPGDSDLNQLHRIFDLCGYPSQETLPKYYKHQLCSEFLEKKPKGEPRSVKGQLASWNIPTLAVDLIASMLALDPLARPSAEDCLEFDWFFTFPAPTPPERMTKYRPSKEYDKRKREDEMMHGIQVAPVQVMPIPPPHMQQQQQPQQRMVSNNYQQQQQQQPYQQQPPYQQQRPAMHQPPPYNPGQQQQQHQQQHPHHQRGPPQPPPQPHAGYAGVSAPQKKGMSRGALLAKVHAKK